MSLLLKSDTFALFVLGWILSGAVGVSAAEPSPWAEATIPDLRQDAMTGSAGPGRQDRPLLHRILGRGVQRGHALANRFEGSRGEDL